MTDRGLCLSARVRFGSRHLATPCTGASAVVDVDVDVTATTREAVRSLLHAEEGNCTAEEDDMIRKLPSGEYRLYSRKKDPKTGRRRNLGTFATREGAEKHERAVQYFKRH